MILTDVLTAADMNPMYYKFIPIFIKTWKKVLPNIKIHIILIADKIIDELEDYKDYIYLFKPIENITTAFISQNIRLFYPALLDSSEGGILITDIDIVPMNKEYYTEPIKKYDNDKFICYRQLECVGKNEMVICYNIAHKNIWREIFSIKSENDIRTQIKNLYNNIKYVGHKNMPFWITDQLYLYEATQKWNLYKQNLIILNDNLTKFKRLDRNRFPDELTLKSSIQSHSYSDYHMLRPYDKYIEINNFIIDLL